MQRLLAAAVVLLAACGHSAPFTSGDYRPDGALVPGLAARLTYGDKTAASPRATADGNAAFYYSSGGSACSLPLVGLCLLVVHPPSPVLRDSVVRDPHDVCLGLLPADGGSAIWSLCDTRFAHGDSTDILGPAALDASGQLLYQESTGRVDFPWPVNYHTELWLADSGTPFVRRQILENFPAARGVNWVSALAWTSPRTFIAAGTVTDPSGDSTGAGLFGGTIAGTMATFVALPGTRAATRFASIDAGAMVVFIDTSLTVSRIPFAGTAPATPWANIPAASGRTLLDVACTASICDVLSSDTATANGPSQLTLWPVSVTDGQVGTPVLLPALAGKVVSAAILLPTGRVMAQVSAALYLVQAKQ